MLKFRHPVGFLLLFWFCVFVFVMIHSEVRAFSVLCGLTCGNPFPRQYGKVSAKFERQRVLLRLGCTHCTQILQEYSYFGIVLMLQKQKKERTMYWGERVSVYFLTGKRTLLLNTSCDNWFGKTFRSHDIKKSAVASFEMDKLMNLLCQETEFFKNF